MSPVNHVDESRVSGMMDFITEKTREFAVSQAPRISSRELPNEERPFIQIYDSEFQRVVKILTWTLHLHLEKIRKLCYLAQRFVFKINLNLY